MEVATELTQYQKNKSGPVVWPNLENYVTYLIGFMSNVDVLEITFFRRPNSGAIVPKPLKFHQNKEYGQPQNFNFS